MQSDLFFTRLLVHFTSSPYGYKVWIPSSSSERRLHSFTSQPVARTRKRAKMSAATAFLAPPSAINRLVARGAKGKTYRRCAAVTPIAGRPSSYPDAKGFSEEDKSGTAVGEEQKQEVLPAVREQPQLEALAVDGGINPGVSPTFEAPPTPISGGNQGSKWLTFYTREDRTPYYFNQVTGETQWCVS